MSLAEHPFWPADKGLKPFDLQAPVQLLVPVGPSICQVCDSPIGDGTGSFTPFRNTLPRPGRVMTAPDPHRLCREQMRNWRKDLEAVESDPSVVSAQKIADAYQEAAGVVYHAAIDGVDAPEWFKEQYLAAQDGGCEC